MLTKATRALRPQRHAANIVRCLCSDASALRFPVGTPVKCLYGDSWVSGIVVKHHYREDSWPEGKTAPYQVLLDEEHVKDEQKNAIWAPSDADDVITSNFRFPIGSDTECRVGLDEWVRCTVVGHMYREDAWPDTRLAPYQVRVVSVLPGSVELEQLEKAVGQLIWVARDNAQNIRDFSDLRWERLQSLANQREAGILGEQEFLDKRSTVIHDENCAFADAE